MERFRIQYVVRRKPGKDRLLFDHVLREGWGDKVDMISKADFPFQSGILLDRSWVQSTSRGAGNRMTVKGKVRK